MSGFEDNPFGEPAVDNPFADPAVQQAARTVPKTNVLEDYNPFEDDNQSRPVGSAVTTTQQSVPAYNQNVQTNNSAYGTAPQISTAELQRRQEELERKAQELDRREEQLRNNAAGIRRNNWPPLPEQCCFQPCFYQDINVEIQAEFQRTVRHLYYLWMFYAMVLCCNVLVSFLLMFHDSFGDYRFSQFVLSLVYGSLFTPASFLCWYRPAYKAFRSDSSFNFMIFFFIFFFQFLTLIYQSFGFRGSGYCGFITSLSQFDNTWSGILFGLLTLVIAISFSLCALGNFLMLTKIHAIYRSSDKVSLGKAQAEFANEFMRNENVQRAAASAAQAAVRSQFNNQAQNANRY